MISTSEKLISPLPPTSYLYTSYAKFLFMSIIINKQTILKFDVPGPRYTSYPTAPVWNESVNESVYIEKLKAFGRGNKTLSLYIHIPFCQTMCTFCGCNVVIRKQDEKYGDEYLSYLFKEMKLVAGYIGRKMKVKQFHLGGGTPTFLSEAQLERLFRQVQKYFDIDLTGEIAIEIDPRTIDYSKLKKLKDLGFNRISMGVQDFTPEVQQQVNRIQSFEVVKDFYGWCRELKFDSINFDLIYGLPEQTKQSFHDTVSKVIQLRPDRVALYSFAYVPWLKKHQQKIDQKELPVQDQKLDIFLDARDQFLSKGYEAIAMDHFALANDELAKSFKEGKLYRNFMGYTVKPADEYLGLGLTSIGFLENTFAQNYKELPKYYELLSENKLPIERGKELNMDDQIRQWVISQLMCQFNVDKIEFKKRFNQDFDSYFAEEKDHMIKCVKDDLLEVSAQKLQATDLGKIFIRNVCMGFDYYLRAKEAHQKFSRTV